MLASLTMVESRMFQPLTEAEGAQLLMVARTTIENVLGGKNQPVWELHKFSEALQEFGSCYVSVYVDDTLRGCLGTYCAWQPLLLDAADGALLAATVDHRFTPCRPMIWRVCESNFPFCHYLENCN